MTNHPEGTWSTRCIPAARPLRIPCAEFGNTAGIRKSSTTPRAMPNRHPGARKTNATQNVCHDGPRGEVRKPGLAQSPAWKRSDMPRDNGLGFAHHRTTPIIPNAANCAVVCLHNWAQLPTCSDAPSLLAAEINTAYTNIYPSSFAIHLPKSEYFLTTQLHATLTHFNTLLPFWPHVQYQMQGIQPYCLRN